jgi:hypothetical protein
MEWLVALLMGWLWAFAGNQTWRLMFLLDREDDTCPLVCAMKNGQSVRSIWIIFLIFWPVLLCAVNLLRIVKR